MESIFKLIEKRIPEKGILIFGYENSSSKCKNLIKQINNKIENIKIFNISENITKINDESELFNSLKEIEYAKRLIQNNEPFVFTIKTSLDKLSSAKINNIFRDSFILNQLSIADQLHSLSKSDCLIINYSESKFFSLEQSDVILTPIEKILLKELNKTDLIVETQKKFGKYIVDFFISKDELNLIVEADGAEFHNKEKDNVRDKNIFEKYKLETFRLSGSLIYHNPEKCVELIINKLNKLENLNKFEYEELEKLDESQKKPVFNQFGHVRVLAPAGSGKTKVLVNRISYLLNNGFIPSSILVLAFNKKAQEELVDRLNHLNIPVSNSLSDNSGILVKTFNALGYQLLINNGFNGELITSNFKIKSLIRDALKQANINLPNLRGVDNLGIIIKHLARITRGLELPSDELIEIYQKNNEKSNEAFSPYFNAIRAYQEKTRQITFDDQIFSALSLIIQESIVRHDWQRRFKHILVDEYQDLNNAQINLVRMILNGGGRIFAVGDDDQLIYSWRNARTQNILNDFENYFPLSSTYCLEINYRCAKSIVLPSQRLINHNQNRFKKKIISSKNATNGVVQVKGFNSLRNQSNYIVNFINKQKKDFNLDWHNIAVLSRYKIQLIEVIRALEQAKIPCSNLPGIKIFSSDIGLIILSYLRVINSLDKCDNYDLNLIINYPNRYVTNDFCKQILKSNNAFNLINEHIKSSEENNEAFRTARLKKFLKDIYHLNNQMKEQGSFELIKSIITIFSLNEFNSDQNVIDIDEADDETYLEIILDASKDFPNITEFILHIEKKIEEEDADNISKNIELENDFNKKVHINTIHSTKGKEWDLVIIFDTSNKLISKIENNPTDIEEERRVFYVGLTRAKKILAVTAKESNPLIFLKEAFIGNEMNKNNYEKIKFELIQIDKSINKIKDESKNLITSISAFEKKIKNINNGNYSIKIKNRIKNNEKKIEEIIINIKKWDNTIPNGFLQRIFSGGYSEKSIEKKINDLKKEIEDYKTENHRFKKSIETETLEKLKSKYSTDINILKNRIKNNTLTITEAHPNYRDLINIYEIYKINYKDISENTEDDIPF